MGLDMQNGASCERGVGRTVLTAARQQGVGGVAARSRLRSDCAGERYQAGDIELSYSVYYRRESPFLNRLYRQDEEEEG